MSSIVAYLSSFVSNVHNDAEEKPEQQQQEEEEEEEPEDVRPSSTLWHSYHNPRCITIPYPAPFHHSRSRFLNCVTQYWEEYGDKGKLTSNP